MPKPLVAALRTSLDKRKDGLVAVFTGSSQDGLRRMFSARQAPFFRFAQPIGLPALGADFVDHQLAAFRSASKARLDRADALAVFERFEANPLIFQRWLMTLALNPTMSGQEAAGLVQDQIAEEFGFTAQWLKLSATQRIAARLLASGIRQVYGREGVAFVDELTGGEAVTTSAMQAAIGRLTRLGHVDKWQDGWRITDPLFEGWIRSRPISDF